MATTKGNTSNSNSTRKVTHGEPLAAPPEVITIPSTTEAAAAATAAAEVAMEAAISVADVLARARALKAAASTKKASRNNGATKDTAARPKPAWPDATIAAAEAIGLELPATYPSKGLGYDGDPAYVNNGQCWIGSPYHEDLNGPVLPEGRNDRGLSALRAALANELSGEPIIPQLKAATQGGLCPWELIFGLLADENIMGLKWPKVFYKSGQTCIVGKIAVVAGRFSVATTQGVRLVRDFYKAN